MDRREREDPAMKKDTILTIAGSDSCSGAGIEIDLKCACAHNVHTTCAVTAVTAQNTCEVTAIQSIDPGIVKAQIDTVFADVPPQAVKIGMLGNADVASAVADALQEHGDVPVVLDPVLVATAGATLTEASVFDLVQGRLIPRSTVITPNIPETLELTGIDPVDAESSRAAASRFMENGANAVLIKGGHSKGEEIVDRLYIGDDIYEFASERLEGDYHGTGCAMSTAIACNMAKGHDVVEAVRLAHSFVSRALRHTIGLGHGTKMFDPLQAIDA